MFNLCLKGVLPPVEKIQVQYTHLMYHAFYNYKCIFYKSICVLPGKNLNISADGIFLNGQIKQIRCSVRVGK